MLLKDTVDESARRITDVSEADMPNVSAVVLAGTVEPVPETESVKQASSITTQAFPTSSPVFTTTPVCGCEMSASQKWNRAICGPPPALNFCSDRQNMWHTLGDDAKSLVTWKNAALLGLATGAAVGIHQDWDDKVRSYTAEHPHRWGNAGESIGYLGDFSVQIPVLAGLYSYSLWDQNEPLHDLSGSLISAYAITTTTTTLLKVAVNSDRPTREFNDGHYGFPSYHTSSSFALASVVDEYYGHRAGLPAYALAGVIGWTRLDNRDHDLSDVVFGAALGYVVGKGVARRHLGQNVDVVPFHDPANGTSGLTVGVSY